LKIDTLITNADLFTMKGDGVGYIDQGAVAIDRGVILEVGDTETLKQEYSAEEAIDAHGKMVLPGFTDAHIHTYWGALRGISQDSSMWMHKGVAPYKNNLTDKHKIAGSKLIVLEGLAAGTTTFGDYGSPINEFANFYDKLGARAALTGMIKEVPEVLDQLDEGDLYPFDVNVGEKTLKENLELIYKWHGHDNNRITTFLGPQGPDFMSKDMLKKVKNIANEKQLKIHMHVAQASREVKQIMGRYEMRPIQFLKELDYLDESLIAVHLTEATNDEVKTLVKRGVSMTLCSGAIGIIRGKVPPATEFINAGGNVALGTDQPSGNNCNQIINEMKLTALFNKLKFEDAKTMPAWKVLRMATIEGAKVLGIDHNVGSIEKGKKADIIFVDLKHKTMQPVIKNPMRNHVPNLVYSARGNEIERVMVDGNTLYLDGHFLTIDESEILNDAQKNSIELTAQISDEAFKETSNYVLMKEGRL